MNKVTSFYITNYRGLYELARTPIRSKKDLIHLLLLIMKMISIDDYKPEDENLGECLIEVDRTSRVFISLKNSDGVSDKHFSFIFPFVLQQKNEIWIMKNKNSSGVISSEIIEFLISLIALGWFDDSNQLSHDLDSFACQFIDELKEYNDTLVITSVLETEIWTTILTLLTFEPGYLRYDFDPDPSRMDEDSHPLHHLDVYFSPSGTFKLGFDSNIGITSQLDFSIFKDILANGKNRKNVCYRLK